MSAHLYHPRPTTCLSKSGEQAICWLKLHYINVPIFIFLTHFWAQTSRSLPSSASTQLSHNHRTHPLPDWCINVHLSVPQRSQRWSYSCLHPVTAVCGHLTIQPPLFSFVQKQEPRDHLFSFPFSQCAGHAGFFCALSISSARKGFPSKLCICRAYVLPGNYQMLWYEKNPRHIAQLKDFFFLKLILLAKKYI